MKLSNFEIIKTTGASPLNIVYFAEIDVTTETGAFFWKKIKTVRRLICREYSNLNGWFFVDTGDFTPGFIVSAMERSYLAKKTYQNDNRATN